MRNDILNFIMNCPQCIREKSGTIIKTTPLKIIPKGPKDSFVIDGWKLHKTLAEKTGYNWVVDIIDHFSKFLMSYPVKNNDAKSTLNCMKQFCLTIGIPNIIQSDNGLEYKNSLWEEFCLNKNIKHIFNSPYHPQTNGVVEISHKEIRHNVMLYYSQNPDNFDLNNAILNAIDIHNNKIHTITKYKPIELINTSNEELINQVITNIEQIDYKKHLDNNKELKEGDHILIKKNVTKTGNRLISKRINLRNNKIIGTITNSYGNGLYSIKVDEEYTYFEKGEEIFAKENQILSITEKEWIILKNNIVDNNNNKNSNSEKTIMIIMTKKHTQKIN